VTPQVASICKSRRKEEGERQCDEEDEEEEAIL